MIRTARILLLLLSLAGATVARAQVPVWPKTTPADVAAAGLNVQITGADYGNGTFVLAVYFGGGPATPTVVPAVYTSPDGITWTRRNLTGLSGRTGTPRFLNGKFLLGLTPAGANGQGGNGVILSSTDGISWTASASLGATISAPGEFAFGNGIYAAPLNSTATQVATSTDGVTWTNRVVVAGSSSSHITFFSGKFYLSAYGPSGGAAGLYSSADGIAWTRITTAPAGPGLLAASPTTLLVTTLNGSTSGQAVSSDGITFTTASPGINLATETIKYLNGAFVVTASADPTSFDLNLARASTDGRTWTTIGSTVAQYFSPEVAYGNGRYVFVGEFDVYSGTTTLAPGGGGSGGGGGTVAAPIIAAQPAAQTSTVGGSVTFTFTVTGTGLTYQWLFNNNAITGATNATYTITGVTAANAGTYAVRVTNGGGTVTSNAATLTVNPVAGNGIAFLGNLSVRARAGSGSETLIVGVTVGGSTGGGTKTVLVRGVGPTLGTFGVGDVLIDPVLAVLNATGATLATNDDWGNDSTVAATSAAVGAFALPAGSKDSALLGSGLAGGGYTLQLTGKAGATGNALVELYDTAAPSSITANSARFTNLSARTFGGTGNDTLIVGFNVTGTGSRRLVIRAVGPGLAAFGVTGTMADPKIELYSGQNKIGENDNWDTSTLAAQQAVGAFALPNGSRDAVLVTTLNPGGYTVQITGGTTGVVLVEAYEAP